VGSEILVVAKDLVPAVAEVTGLKGRIVAEAKGRAFEKKTAEHPFLSRKSLVVLGEHVTLDAGTGIVHTAPGHGLEDYVVGQRYGLPVESPVNEAGRFTAEVGEWVGLSIWEANPKIVEKLNELGRLVSVKEFVHQYPYGPRSKGPLIFRATPQWFIRMDETSFPLRQKCLTAAEKEIRYVPGWGSQRLLGMLGNAPDWCVSRQRIWGVPVPVFYCTKCDEPLVNAQAMRRLADTMESSGLGLEAYHQRPASEFTKGLKCGACGHVEFRPGKDILDVWFDSGVCHTAVQERHPDLGAPADIYLEGSDQHRGWFQTSLVSALAKGGKAPFKTLITHGFVTDAQGYKMSKSLGNTVDPEDIIKESGAEILRLWAAHEDYGQDLTINREMIARISDSYRRFRNTIRFMLGNLNDFDPSRDAVDPRAMTPLDQWALTQLNLLIEKCQTGYEAFEFYKVYHGLNAFFAHDLSATYLDILKDRLYTGRADGAKRRAAQTVLYEITHALCGLMAPITSFLAEETYSYLPGPREESVFLTSFPAPRATWTHAKAHADVSALLEVRAQMNKYLEELRREKIIGASLEASVQFELPQHLYDLFNAYRQHLRELFIVSHVTFHAGKDAAVTIQAKKAEGVKCERCWTYDPQTGSDHRFPGVCPKCVEALA
jgi:isoleucyl-tRNA synthetase